MPPKVRHRHSVEPKNEKMYNKTSVKQANNVSLNTELEQQFELELCWCIQQLQIALKSGKLNSKQVQDHTKALNTLMNNSSSIIKKRQIMRLSFGDYRAKMADEAKKKSRNALQMTVKPGIPKKNSVFIKKSTFACSHRSTFRFNFTPDNIQSAISAISMQSTESNDSNNKHNTTNYCHFLPSDNSFQFKFDTTETF